MNKIQWTVLSIASYLLAILFMRISLQWRAICDLMNTETFKLVACIRADTFAAYPYIFFVLGIVFMILCFLEKEK